MQEYLQALVRIALERCKTGAVTDASEAVDQLCRHDMLPHLPRAARQNSNAFRSRCCYLESVDRVLRVHMTTLRSLFGRYADLPEGSGARTAFGLRLGSGLDSATLMSLGEWMTMLTHLGFFETSQLSFYEAKLIFLWSRIRSMPDHSNRSHSRMRQLTFEDMMEGFVRISTLIALPTDEELEAVGVADAGSFLFGLRAEAPTEFAAFVARRHGSWWEHPRQHVARCIEHLMAYIAHTIEANIKVGVMDGSITKEEAKAFSKLREEGISLAWATQSNEVLRREAGDGVVTAAHPRASPLAGRSQRRVVATEPPHTRVRRSGYSDALQQVQERRLESLRAVPMFQGVDDATLTRLRDSMSDEPFAPGEYVFHQGDPSDGFYVVRGGHAEAVRFHQGTGRDEVVATMEEGSCFGEEALLGEEVRRVSVRVVGPQLRTLSIRRATFEAALGPLQALLSSIQRRNQSTKPGTPTLQITEDEASTQHAADGGDAENHAAEP